MKCELTKLLRYLRRHRLNAMSQFRRDTDPRPDAYSDGYAEGYDSAMETCIQHLARIAEKPKRKERR